MKNPRSISTVGPENFWAFNIPTYSVTNDGIVDGEGTEVRFCKGDKSDESKERQSGIFAESLLEVVATRLRGVNVGDLASQETSNAIMRIEEAIMWLEKRSNDRKTRGVEQTYQK